VGDYYLVRRAQGPAWDHSVPRRQQAGWDEHAAFMESLVEEGFVVLGGPVGEADGDDALNLIEAESEAAVRARLADDPWPEEMLTIAKVERWSVWLGKLT
jgi:uncharacterized protein YciI